MLRPRNLSLILLSALVLAGLLAWWLQQDRAPAQARESAPLGLFTTLPLYWGEAADISDTIAGRVQPHWARAAIERDYGLQPLDVLTEESLAPFRRLLLAQPRVLSPQENVALDAWVRGGGKLLLLADPLLTAESRFALGDPRRPADTVLLSPILTHWGLELQFDESQPAGERMREAMGADIPVNLAGHFLTRGQDNCRLWDDGLAVTCAIGKGRVVAFADAAVLETGDETGPREDALRFLLDTAFAAR
jgi:hypothetical protein